MSPSAMRSSRVVLWASYPHGGQMRIPSAATVRTAGRHILSRRRNGFAHPRLKGVNRRIEPMLKFIGGTVGVIFLIGLLVVIGLLALIF